MDESEQSATVNAGAIFVIRPGAEEERGKGGGGEGRMPAHQQHRSSIVLFRSYCRLLRNLQGIDVK